MAERVIWRSLWARARSFVLEFWGQFSDIRIRLAAASLAYFTLLSIIPLLLFVISLIGLFMDPQRVEALLAALGTGELALAIRTEIVSAIGQKHISSLFSVLSLLLSLWAGSQVFLNMEATMNMIVESEERRPLYRRVALALLMVLVVGTLLVAAAIAVNVSGYLIGLGGVSEVLASMASLLLPFFLVGALLIVIYRVLPSKKLPLCTILPGAMLAAGLWLIVTRLYGWYTTNITNFNVIYGPIGAVVLLLLWFYYSGYVMLLGAVVSSTYHRRLARAGNPRERAVDEREAQAEQAMHLRHRPA